MSTIIRGSGDTTFGGTIQSTGIDDNATSTAITIDANENVGIGTSSPQGNLHISGGTGDASLILQADTDNSGETDQPRIELWQDGSNAWNAIGALDPTADNALVLANSIGNAGGIIFKTNTDNAGWTAATERMRIDSSGNVLVGTTSSSIYNDTSGNGIQLNGASGQIVVAKQSTSSADPALWLNNTGVDGAIATFAKDGTTVGSIGTQNGTDFFIACVSQAAALRFQDNEIVPVTSLGANRDNAIDLGKSNIRFDDIYATNGTIQTSDRNEKQDIEELSEAEQRVAIACKGLLRKFRWQDAVAEKGDDARIHFGIIAQDLQDAFTAEGLDAGRYAMFISTTWYEKEVEVPAVEAVEAVEATYDDEGAELTPAVEAVEAKDAYIRTDTEEEPTEGYTERTRLGVRYPELLAFIISAI